MITKKTKNKRPRRLALALAVCLICGQIAAVHAVPDSTMYTLVLQYNDAIQLTYAHGQGGEHWETTGDVPLGGAHINGKDGPLVLPQIYCADAEVPFHPYANGGRGGSSSEWIKGVLTDIVPNYVSVAPDQAPATLKAHWRQLEWVIVNGYQGTKESTDRMNGKFKLSDAGGALGPFGYDVAVTATKAVVWHFTNPDVKFLSTGFLARSGNEPDSPNGIKHRQFLALFDALANGAEGYAADPSQGLYSDDEVRPYGIDFDNANAGISPVDDGSGLVWGPCYVRETDASYSSRPAGNVKRVREPALLQLSSPIAGTVFYDGHPDQGGKPLKSEPIYGNGSGTLPGLPVSDPVDENPSSDAPFYIFLPLQDEEDLQKATAVTALAKEELSEVNGREVEVPTVLVYQDPVTGQQDWNMVQAFIGAGHDPLVQYANAAIPFGSSGSGQVSVSKVHYAGSGGPFRFQITDAGGAPVYLHDGNFSKYHESAGNAEIISGIDGTFSLNDGSMGVISGLPFGEYAITESFSDDYSASYDVYDSNAFKTAAGRTVSFEVTEKQPTAAVVCRNSPGPFDISIAKISTGSEGSPLEGARFRIERQDGGFVDEKYSDKAGGVIFTDLLWSFSAPDMRSYTITELAAPSGYTRMSGPIKIALDDNGIISTAETDPADAELVYIDGIGSRHLRLMISNAPVPPPKPITPGTGVIPPPPGPPAPAPPTPTSPAVTPPPPTPPAPVPPAPVPPTPPDSGTTPPPPDSGDTPPAPPTPVPPIEPPGPGSTPPHDPSATPPGPGGTPPHVSGATPPPEDYTTLGLGALPTDYYLTSPQTDDNSNIPLWALLGGAALAGLILVGAALRRRWQANRAG